MNELDYRNVEPWMHLVMEKYWAGQTWSKAVRSVVSEEFLDNPRMYDPRSMGKILIPNKCSICQDIIIGYFANRKENNVGLEWGRSAACVACRHKPFASRCNCSSCFALHRIEEERQRKEVQEKAILEKELLRECVEKWLQKRNQEVYSLENCSYKEGAILLAMLVQSTSEHLFIITPVQESGFFLMPNANKSEEDLYEETSYLKYLQFLDSCPNSIRLEENSFSWDIDRESYKVFGDFPDPKGYLLNKLRTNSFDCPCAEYIALNIRGLMIDEALDFLEKTKENYGLLHQVGEKTKLLFDHLIIERPLGEIFFLIWRIGVNSAVAIQKKSITRREASNRMIGEIERLHIRTRNNGWQLTSYKRFNFEKQNWLSYVYFNLILELPGEGLEYSLLDILKRPQLKELTFESPILEKLAPAMLKELKAERGL